MDYQSVGLLIGLIAEGIGVASELQRLAVRIQKGEIISRDEIEKQRALIRTAVKGWDEGGGD